MGNVYYVANKTNCIEICKECASHETCNGCQFWLSSVKKGYCDIARQFGTPPYEWEKGGMYEKCIAPGKFKLANLTDEFLKGSKGDDEYVVMGR